MADSDPILEAIRVAMFGLRTDEELSSRELTQLRRVAAVARDLVAAEREKGDRKFSQEYVDSLQATMQELERQVAAERERCIAIVEALSNSLAGKIERVGPVSLCAEIIARLRSELSPPTTPEEWTCASCGGDGQVDVTFRYGVERYDCEDCDGTGKVPRPSPSPQPEETT